MVRSLTVAALTCAVAALTCAVAALTCAVAALACAVAALACAVAALACAVAALIERGVDGGLRGWAVAPGARGERAAMATPGRTGRGLRV